MIIKSEDELYKGTYTKTEAAGIFEELRKQAVDVPEMSLDEINAEIKAARSERKISKM